MNLTGIALLSVNWTISGDFRYYRVYATYTNVVMSCICQGQINEKGVNPLFSLFVICTFQYGICQSGVKDS